MMVFLTYIMPKAQIVLNEKLQRQIFIHNNSRCLNKFFII